MYWVFYHCPAISHNWLPAGCPFDYAYALARCRVVKPNSLLGRAQVRDEYGRVVYSI